MFFRTRRTCDVSLGESMVSVAACRRMGFVLALASAASASALAQVVENPSEAAASPDLVLRPGQFVQRTETPSSAPVADVEMENAFSATYVGADVNLVINAILGQFLQVPYTVAPDVQGTVTLGIEGIRTRSAGIGLLRSALQPLGIAVIDRGNVVAIVRAGMQQDGPVNAAVIEPGQPSPPGGGVAILIPRFVEPSQLGPLISPFSNVSGGSSMIALADDRHRMLILRGDEQTITAASRAAAMFDVDWFSQVSTATFTLQHVAPKDLVSELKSVLGPAAGGVEFVPMPRLSQLIVFSRRPDTLTAISDWVKKLDVTSGQITGGMLLYTARHMSAEELAESLQDAGPTDGSEISPAMASPAAAPAGAAVSSPYAAPLAATGSATLPAGGKSGAMSVSTNARQNIVIVRGNSDQLAEARALFGSPRPTGGAGSHRGRDRRGHPQ
jgi:general secretion pathway protein D